MQSTFLSSQQILALQQAFFSSYGQIEKFCDFHYGYTEVKLIDSIFGFCFDNVDSKKEFLVHFSV